MRVTPIFRERPEDGQSMVVSILFLTVLIGFCALLIEGGSWFWMRRSLQGDADAAALAAVRELPRTPGQARSVAEDYVERRNSDDQARMTSFASDTATMRATVEVGRAEAATPFGGFIGLGTTDIGARATARIAQISSVDGVLPFAALEGTVDITHPPSQETLTIAPGGIERGHIGTIAPRYSPPACSSGTTNSANELNKAIKSWHGPDGLTTCGTGTGNQVSTATGARPNTLQDGINKRFGTTNGTHPDRFDDVLSWDSESGRYVVDKPESPRIGFIPIISTGNSAISDWGDISGTSMSVKVIDYVMVYIGHTGLPGEPGYVTGADCMPTACPSNHLQIVVTPILGMITPNFDYELASTWNPDSRAPLGITLVE